MTRQRVSRLGRSLVDDDDAPLSLAAEGHRQWLRLAVKGEIGLMLCRALGTLRTKTSRSIGRVYTALNWSMGTSMSAVVTAPNAGSAAAPCERPGAGHPASHQSPAMALKQNSTGRKPTSSGQVPAA